MKTKKIPYFALSAITLALIGCGGGGGGENNNNSSGNSGGAPLAQADNDGDGLTNAEELLYGTNKDIADTDGDGFSDYEEINDLAFNANVNNYSFNPLVADVPQLDVQVAQTPTIYLTYTEGQGSSRQVSTEHSTSRSDVTSKSWGGSNSTTLETSHTIGIEQEINYSLTGFGGSTTLSYESTTTRSNSSTVEWSKEQSQENSRTLAEAEALETNNNVSFESGVLATTVEITNGGHIAYKLNGLSLSSFTLNSDSDDATELAPIGELRTRRTSSGFEATVLQPGENVTFVFDADLDVPTTKDLLDDSSNLVFQPVVGGLTGGDDFTFDFASTDILALTAQVIIDYGLNEEVEHYQVATITDNKNPGVSLSQVFNEILKIPYTTGQASWDYGSGGVKDSFEGLTSVRDYNTDNETASYWVITHTHKINNGADTVTDFYSLLESDYDFDNIILQKSDTLSLVRIEDSDRDGLANRSEFLHGTDPQNDDTDGDNLLDGLEVQGWEVAQHDGTKTRYTSNPLLVDTDFDGTSDFDEQVQGTDPRFAPHVAPVIDSVSTMVDGVNVELTVNLAGVSTLQTLEVNWGNGVTTTESVSDTKKKAFSHSYSKLGMYNITVVATDQEGSMSQKKSTTVSTEISEQGLLLHVPFNNSLTKLRGSGDFDSTVVGPVFSTDRRGYGERALDFDATDAHAGKSLTLSTDHFLTNETTADSQLTDVTIAAWGKDGLPPVGQQEWYTLDHNGFGVDANASPDVSQLYVQSHELYDSRWSFYVGVAQYDAGMNKTTLKFYKDGHKAGEESFEGRFFNPGSCRFVIGPLVDAADCTKAYDKDDDSASVSRSQIDDLRVYNRALSAGEIKALYFEGGSYIKPVF